MTSPPPSTGALSCRLPHDSEAAGSGCHAHLSLWKDGANIFPSGTDSNKHGMSASAQHFVAGILHHLPALLAFTSPHPLSYARIRPYTWSGAFQVWGRDNKEAPLRTCSPPGAAAGAVTNVEVKSLDGCANPHLGLAALAAAGLDGLRKRMALPDPTGECVLSVLCCVFVGTGVVRKKKKKKGMVA